MAYWDSRKRVWRETFAAGGRRYARVLRDDQGRPLADARAAKKAIAAEALARQEALASAKRTATTAVGAADEEMAREASTEDVELRYCFGRVAYRYLHTLPAGRHRANLEAHVARLIRSPMIDPQEVKPGKTQHERERDSEPLIPPEIDIRCINAALLRDVLARLLRRRVLVRIRPGPTCLGGWKLPDWKPGPEMKRPPRLSGRRRKGAAVSPKIGWGDPPSGWEPPTLSAQSARHYMKTIGYIMHFAEEDGLLAGAPKRPTVRVPKRIPSPIEGHEIAKLMSTPGPAHLKAGIALSYAFGFRRFEAFQARRSWLSLHAKPPTLRLPHSVTKSDKDEIFPIPEYALPLLCRLDQEAAEAGRDHLLVYYDRATGNWRPITSPRTAWRSLLAKADIPHRRFHDLRAGFITALFQAGNDAVTVMDLARHASLATTQRYAKAYEQCRLEALRKKGDIDISSAAS